MLRVTIEAMNCVCKPGRPCAYHRYSLGSRKVAGLAAYRSISDLPRFDGSSIPDQQHEAAIVRAELRARRLTLEPL